MKTNRSAGEIREDLLNGLLKIKRDLQSLSTKQGPIFFATLKFSPFVIRVLLDYGIIKHVAMDKATKLYTWCYGEEDIDMDLVETIHKSSIEMESANTKRLTEIRKLRKLDVSSVVSEDPNVLLNKKERPRSLTSFEELGTVYNKKPEEKIVKETIVKNKPVVKSTSKVAFSHEQLMFLNSMRVDCNIILNNFVKIHNVSVLKFSMEDPGNLKVSMMNSNNETISEVLCYCPLEMHNTTLEGVATLFLKICES